MADPVALGIQVPDSFKTIGSMLDFAGKSQNLQRGNIDLQQNQIKLQERLGIQKLFSDPRQFTNEDGSTNYNKLIPSIMEVAPTTGAEIVPRVIQGHKAAAEAQKELNALDSNRRTAVGQYIMSLGADDPKTGIAKIDALTQVSPELKGTANLFKGILTHAAQQGPDGWKQGVFQIGRMAMTPAEQRGSMTPSYTDTGGTLQQTNPMATGAQQTLPKTLTPGSLETIETDAVGNKSVVSRSPQGAILSTRPMPGSAVPSTGEPPAAGGGFATLPPGGREDIPIVTKERADTNAAASQVPTQRFNNKQIVEILSNPTPGFLSQTGAGAQQLARLGSALGVPLGDDYATNLQKLGHYLALQTQSNAKAMGAGTDAAREVSAMTTGDTKMTPAALLNIAKVNDALATGVAKFNEGMEASIKNSGGNVLAAREFKNAWSRAFDPDVYRYANAVESNDAKEIDAILGAKGTPERAAKARALATKYQTLNRLVGQGR